MTAVPIIRLGNTLIATVLEDLTDHDAMAFQEEISRTIERFGSSGVLLNLSAVEIIDSFLGRLINDVVSTSRLLGAETVVVGIQPAVAVTLVELGLQLPGVHTALDVEKGLKRLREAGHYVG